MNNIESYFNEEELAEIKEVTKRINAYSQQIEKETSEEGKVSLIQEMTAHKERLEDIRIQVFRREYNKLDEDGQYQWWITEFENQIKARAGGEYLYKMFSAEQYEYWLKLDSEFDEILFRLCLDFELEYEYAFTLCEHDRDSEIWNHLLDSNMD